ncbi:NAD(P)H-dependent glycerol-3-phosphate dehydrogenase [Hippea jasoniae]|uniref:NAD(P)H-dependent glycerol-3-phosphate dehydrogenase n=1 Tax=Hippea jasoniae TaxID=944479 RepID=UPI00068FD865|nr:NAD(P)H-dependent glycerol-3-phosphate dehydrogenase [Hippea jasoniae]
MKKMYKIGVVGAGSWGTTIADLLAENNDVKLFVRNRKLLEQLKKTGINNIYLKDIQLNKNLNYTNNIDKLFKESEIIVIAIPTKFIRSVLTGKILNKSSYVISLSKGIETKTFKRPSQIISETLRIENERIAVLSGPNFAVEVAKKLPTATVVASVNLELAEFFQKLFFRNYFRVYTSSDVVGVEFCGALKNIMAIASGVSDGLGLGFNARASLITRALVEMKRLGLAFGSDEQTFNGLAGIGDLILTCTGSLSRNRQVGLRIAKGEKLDDILNSMQMVPEGVSTVLAVKEFSKKHNIEMPICSEVYEVLFENKNPLNAISALMSRPKKQENYLL